MDHAYIAIGGFAEGINHVIEFVRNFKSDDPTPKPKDTLTPIENDRKETTVPESTPQSTNPAPGVERKFVIVVMDTSLTKKVYDPDLVKQGFKNSHFICEKIHSDKSIYAPTQGIEVIVSSDPDKRSNDAYLVRQHDPDLIILHRSTFDTELHEDYDGARLAGFLKEVADLKAKVLIYSRKPDTDADFVEKISKLSGVEKGRISIYEFRPGNPFKNDGQMLSFMNELRRVVEEINSKRK